MVRQSKILLQRNRWLQVGALIGLWWLCQIAAERLALPIPGSVIGLMVLLALLASGRLRTIWLRRGATSLLDHMMLFFVPAVMALLNHRELLGMEGLKILAVILVSTVAVMVGTALVVELVFVFGKTNAR